MRLLILSIEFPPGPGGYGTLAYQAALQLARFGWQVAVATPQDHVKEAEIERFNQSRPFRILRLRKVEPPPLEGMYRLGKILLEVNNCRPDVILAIGRQAAWLGELVASLVNIPTGVVGVGTEFLVAGKFDRALTRWAFGRANLVITISTYVYELARSRQFDLSRARVILCGADDELYLPGLPTDRFRAQLNLNQKRIILTVGQMSERKAQDVVIRALPSVIQKVPNLIYLIVGLPTKQNELEKLAGDLGVRDHVRFLGQVPQSELPYYYNLADVFVLVSRHAGVDDVEGFGIAAVEAALCGKPAVVSSNSGLGEAVLPGETALVIPPNDPEATANALTRLILDDILRRKMGEAAYRYASQNATWKKRMRQYHTALSQLVASIPCDS